MVDEIIALLDSTGFRASRLKLEVTESVVMKDASIGPTDFIGRIGGE